MLFVIRSPLDLYRGRCFGTVTLVAAFKRCMKKIRSSVDVKMERGHLERIKKAVRNASE